MTMRTQLRWSGLLIIVVSLLMNGMNILVYSNYHNALIQAIYGIGFVGLVLAATFIHIAQAQRAGIPGTLAYVICVLSLVYANVITFLILAELAGVEGAQQTIVEIWNPVMHIAVYGVYVGWTLLGISVAQAGVLPRGAGILVALGVAIQLPAQYAMEIAGPLFFLFTIGGSLLFGAGLIWIGWALWSGKALQEEEPHLSNPDRAWGAPFVILTALLMTINAYVNTFGELTLLDGAVHLFGYTTLIFSVVILYTAQAERAGGFGLAGFLCLHLGAILTLIPAYFIMAQLAGQIDNNRALMATWVDIPIGRAGLYMVLLGLLLFGVAVIRAEVFPRWSGWLIVIGLALLVPSQFQSQAYLFSIFWVIGATFQGIGLAWMGWTLLNRGVAKQVVQLSESSP
ncbi:MAG TPA: hypothetical protein VK897_22015 [Anaerolineales bacterium]|nr:hypothetical protein [Anaerolineales bacterium]